MSGFFGPSGSPTLATGGTGSDLSATGGAGQVVKQSTAGGALTVGTLTASEMGAIFNTVATNDIVKKNSSGELAPSGLSDDGSTITVSRLLSSSSPLRLSAAVALSSSEYGIARPSTLVTRLSCASNSTTSVQLSNGNTPQISAWSVGVAIGGAHSAAPARQLEIIDSAAAQQRWTHTASTKYAERQVDTNGYVYETATGNRWYLAYLSDTTKHLGILVNSSGQAILRASGTEIYLETDGGTNVVQIIGNAAGLTKLTFGKGFWLKGGSSSPSLLEAGTGQYVGLSDGSGNLRLAVDATGIGFHGSTPVAKQTLPTALTDSTGGSASDTLAAITTTGITDTVAQDAIIALKNAVASLAAKINGQRTTFIATTLVS